MFFQVCKPRWIRPKESQEGFPLPRWESVGHQGQGCEVWAWNGGIVGICWVFLDEILQNWYPQYSPSWTYGMAMEREREYLIYIYIHFNSQQSLAALQCNSVKSIEIHRNPSNHHLYLNAIPATLRKSVAAHGKGQPLNRMGITYRSLPPKKETS